MIVKMKHLDLLCLGEDGENTLLNLRKLGGVHLDLAQASGAQVSAERGKMADAETAYRAIMKARGEIDADIISPVKFGAKGIEEVLSLQAENDTLKSEVERLERLVKEYAPYGDFDPSLAQKLLDAGVDLSSVVEIPKKLPEKRLSALTVELEETLAKIKANKLRIAKSDEKKIEKEFPGLKERIEFAAAKELMAEKGALKHISGWIPVTEIEALKSAAKENGWGLLLRDPAEDETPPTLIKPPKLFRPVKALFEGLGIAPGYTESDVSVPFMCYFSIFFAMLVGDGGYGAIFLAATLFAWKKFGANAWVKLLIVFSLGTIAWGVLSDTWFGAHLLLKQVGEDQLVPRFGSLACLCQPALWLAGAALEKAQQYNNMMFLCFTIGVSHLMLARLWNGLCRLNSLSCFSQFGWAGIVLFMYIVTNSIVGIFSGIPTWAFYMFGASFLIVFIQSKGIDKGMLFLNAMSVLGDIISYVRLFAVGLASVKVAENFNTMAIGLGMPIFIKWLPLALILLIGHGLNLAMAGLSILVHAVRLNTLEFSNHKGISWAGYQFKAFKKQEK